MMQRDRELGDALRAALTRPDEAAFVQRVLTRIEERGAWWEVLGGWARLGLAAALLLAAVSGFWLGRTLGPVPGTALDDLTPANGVGGQMTALFDASTPPDLDVLLAVASGQE